MSTATQDPHAPRLNLFTWDDLLEAYTRTGNDFSYKKDIHNEMRRRVKLGWQGNESYAPLRLFHA